MELRRIGYRVKNNYKKVHKAKSKIKDWIKL